MDAAYPQRHHIPPEVMTLSIAVAEQASPPGGANRAAEQEFSGLKPTRFDMPDAITPRQLPGQGHEPIDPDLSELPKAGSRMVEPRR